MQSRQAEAGTLIQPWDEHNKALIANVHPSDWINPQPASRYNLVVIGAGTAGLVTAAGAAGLGARVALIERHLMGGDCLNVGCVPSKAVIRSSRVLRDLAEARDFGIQAGPSMQVDFAAVMERMRRLRAGISGHDSAKRFASLGVDVFLGQACFAGHNRVRVGDRELRFKRAVIASGARAGVPSIPGLRETGYLTNETVFNLVTGPERLAVLGGGPIGCELAQAFQRLGSRVTLFHKNSHLLDREDPDAAEILQRRFREERIDLVLNSKVTRVEAKKNEKCLSYEKDRRTITLAVDEILVATGRAPNVEDLNLPLAGVRFDTQRGIDVNDCLQTTNPKIYAVGDVCMNWKFTHAADAAARLVIQNTLFLGRKKLSSLIMPWCTYTDPEIAHVGLYERDAAERGWKVDTFMQPLSKVDRARLDGEVEGFVKIHTRRGTDQILGATIVAKHAGEMISELTLAMNARTGLKTISSVIHPYPTQSEAIRQCADAYNRTRLTPGVKKLFASWLRWTR